jgi:hypothetical protein
MRMAEGGLTLVSGLANLPDFSNRISAFSTGHVENAERSVPSSRIKSIGGDRSLPFWTGVGGTVVPLSRVGPAYRTDQVVSVSGDPERRPGGVSWRFATN